MKDRDNRIINGCVQTNTSGAPHQIRAPTSLPRKAKRLFHLVHDEIYKLEQAIRTDTQVSMWNNYLFQENSHLRERCQHLQRENDRARRLLWNQLARSSSDLDGSSQERSKCDGCGLTTRDVRLALCFHRFCQTCDDSSVTDAGRDAIPICKLCPPSAFPQPACS